ncbi:MAG: hypothetical protein AAF500_16405 [Myxococcota bacterium]
MSLRNSAATVLERLSSEEDRTLVHLEIAVLEILKSEIAAEAVFAQSCAYEGGDEIVAAYLSGAWREAALQHDEDVASLASVLHEAEVPLHYALTKMLSENALWRLNEELVRLRGTKGCPGEIQ